MLVGIEVACIVILAVGEDQTGAALSSFHQVYLAAPRLDARLKVKAIFGQMH